MEITITYEMTRSLGADKLVPFGIDPHAARYPGSKYQVSVLDWNKAQFENFLKLLDGSADKIRGVASLKKDLKMYMQASTADTSAVCADAAVFAKALKELIGAVESHRIYERDDDYEFWRAFYVNEISYHPKRRIRNYDDEGFYTAPAYVTLDLMHYVFGEMKRKSVTIKESEISGQTAAAALLKEGFIVETEELRKEHEEETERYFRLVHQIGTQMLVRGFVDPNVDGNSDDDEDQDRNRYYRWWSDTASKYRAENQDTGDLAVMVIDVHAENEKKDVNRWWHSTPTMEKVNEKFWASAGFKIKAKLVEAEDEDEDEDDDENEAEEETNVDKAKLEKAIADRKNHPIPTEFMVTLFDLRRQKRVRAHLSQTLEYGYDAKIGNKLVLPDEQRDLIEMMLLSTTSAFTDVVKGKGTGSMILCTGSPGTGKTLTSEVMSEVMQKPLYNVPASQLGVDPKKLERNLLKVFARGRRWGAILLIDECDVYVRRRGDDMKQNEIVGVLLRNLEYYPGVMFLTTNRGDLVDDAIASRCLARIDYKIPTPSNQARIWRVQAAQAGQTISPAQIADIVAEYPNLSGRDIKNIMALATRIAATKGEPVTLDTIRFAKAFKPTEEAEIRRGEIRNEKLSDETKAQLIAELAKPERKARKL